MKYNIIYSIPVNETIGEKPHLTGLDFLTELTECFQNFFIENARIKEFIKLHILGKSSVFFEFNIYNWLKKNID